jgi:hypothetical protein
MKEGAPRTPRQEMAHASMEGNVWMPQNGLGISIRTAERILSQEDPKAAVKELIAAIPNDEQLEIRTNKANAQHVLHGIPRVLKNEDVRGILQGGNISTLNLLSSALGFTGTLTAAMTYPTDAEGNWATDEMRTRVADVEQVLRPEVAESLKSLLKSVKETSELPHVKELLTKRKELYKGWKDKDTSMRADDQTDINRLTNDVAQILTEAVFDAGEKRGDMMSKVIAAKIMMEIGKNVPRF